MRNDGLDEAEAGIKIVGTPLIPGTCEENTDEEEGRNKEGGNIFLLEKLGVTNTRISSSFPVNMAIWG